VKVLQQRVGDLLAGGVAWVPEDEDLEDRRDQHGFTRTAQL
jgi:hypothetical protein